MELDSSSDETYDMQVALKRTGFTKTSKRVWKLDQKSHIITFVGAGPDPESYDIRIRIPGTDAFGDNDMRLLWKSLRDEPDPVRSVVEWALVNAVVTDTPGFSVDVVIGDGPTEKIALTREPDRNRRLRIYSYGIAIRKNKPDNSQRNWFVGVMTTKPHGVDLRKYNGRSLEVQAGIAKDPKFASIMSNIVDSVESDNLTCISIACTKGRHRSVAVAELLKSWFYPDAEVIHLTIS